METRWVKKLDNLDSSRFMVNDKNLKPTCHFQDSTDKTNFTSIHINGADYPRQVSISFHSLDKTVCDKIEGSMKRQGLNVDPPLHQLIHSDSPFISIQPFIQQCPRQSVTVQVSPEKIGFAFGSIHTHYRLSYDISYELNYLFNLKFNIDPSAFLDRLKALIDKSVELKTQGQEDPALYKLNEVRARVQLAANPDIATEVAKKCHEQQLLDEVSYYYDHLRQNLSPMESMVLLQKISGSVNRVSSQPSDACSSPAKPNPMSKHPKSSDLEFARAKAAFDKGERNDSLLNKLQRYSIWKNQHSRHHHSVKRDEAKQMIATFRK